MKKFWKALGIAGIAALAAAAVPIRVRKDEEKRKKTYQSLLLSVDVGPAEDGEGTAVDVNFEEGVLTGAITGLVTAKKEAELYADDELEAAVPDGSELQVIADEAQRAADEAQAIADEAQAAADEVRAIADEAQAAVDAAAGAAAVQADDDDESDSAF